MPPYRDAPAGRAEIRLRRDNILLVAQVITNIGQYFNQHDANVSRAALIPLWHQEGQAIKHQLAEARKVPREVINFGRLRQFRLTDLGRFTVDIMRIDAIDVVEVEVDLRELRVKLENVRIRLQQQGIG